MQLQIINGPGLNLLGIREPHIYGTEAFEPYLAALRSRHPGVTIHYLQTNWEGAIIDKLQETGFSFDGIILNAGAYSHTSIAIADTITAITTPVVEVHISNIHAREAFRAHSYTAGSSRGVITGLGLEGYGLAVAYFAQQGSTGR